MKKGKKILRHKKSPEAVRRRSAEKNKFSDEISSNKILQH